MQSFFYAITLVFYSVLETPCISRSIGVPVRAINRPGSQQLGANGRDDGPVVSFMLKSLYISFIKTKLSSCLLSSDFVCNPKEI